MEECALCGKRARMYCESDQAKLCWDCDDKVHGANFLVAKHTRVLLCRACQSSTPWQACGPKLTPTHSLCLHCATNPTSNSHNEREDGDHDRHDHRDSEDDDGDSNSDTGSHSDLGSDEDNEEEDEEEGENQVVPWSSASASASALSPSPPLRSSASAGAGLAWKRARGSSFADSDDEIGCSSSEMPSAAQLPDDDLLSSWRIFSPWKQPRTTQRSQLPLVEDDALWRDLNR